MPDTPDLNDDFLSDEIDTDSSPSPLHPNEAECAVLGALINDKAAIDHIGILHPEDFSEAMHRVIFGVIQKLEQSGKLVDLITLSDALRRHSDFHEYPELLDYTRWVTDENFSSEGVQHYANLIRDHATQRRLRSACNQIRAITNDPKGRDAAELINVAEALIHGVSQTEQQGRDDFRKISHAAQTAMADIQERYEWAQAHPGKTPASGAPTGFGYFDTQTSGMQPGELVILAGKPGMGKTSLAMTIASNIVAGNTPGTEDAVVGIFSMEMSGEQLANRLLAMMAGVNQKKLHKGNLEDADWTKIESAYRMLDGPNLYIQEMPHATPSFIRRTARRLKAQHRSEAHKEGRLDLIIIDYLQLMPTDQQRRDSNRNAELSVITRELKSIATELKTPVLCLSQLNRQGSGRDAGEAPKLQELRDSGAIEQDADLVIFLYEAAQEDGESENADICDTILEVAKNRNGPTFRMELIFTKSLTHFLPKAPEAYDVEVVRFGKVRGFEEENR